MSTATPDDILAAAAAEVADADAELQRLEAAVIADDQDITPAVIEEARGRKYFAALRRQAAEKKAAALREQQAAALREAAYAEARALLDATPQADVDAALAAAGEAMAALRTAVRARNKAHEQALAVLRACPAIEAMQQPAVHIKGQPRWQPPKFGLTERPSSLADRWVLWDDGRPLGRLDENALLDAARKAPANADYQAGQEAREQAVTARDAAREAKRAERRRTDPNAL